MKKPVIILVVFILVGAWLSAETLSLEQARALALLNSRSLAKYNLAVQSNLLTERTYFHQDMPSIFLNGEASTNLWTRDGFNQDPIGEISVRAGLSVSQTLRIYDGGINSIRKAINSLNTETSRQDALAEYFSVLSALDAAFFSVMEAEAALEAAESSLGIADLSLSMAEIRRQSGMISDSDYLQALSEKAGRETSRIQSRRDLTVAKLRLKDLLGLDEVPALTPLDLGSQEELILFFANLDDAGFDSLFTVFWRHIQANNPSMIRAALNSERSEKNASIASKGYLPSVSASLSGGVNYSLDSGFSPGGGELSLKATIPLEFWKTAADVQKQKIALEQSSLDFRSAVSSLDIQLRTALLDLISQANQILSSRRALDYAERHFDYTLELYRLSRNSLSDLYNAETTFMNNRNQLSRSQYSFLNGISDLRSMGAFDSEEDIHALIRSVH